MTPYVSAGTKYFQNRVQFPLFLGSHVFNATAAECPRPLYLHMQGITPGVYTAHRICA